MLSRIAVSTRRAATNAAGVNARQFSSIFETKNTIKETRAKYYSNPAVGEKNMTTDDENTRERERLVRT